MLSRPPDRFEEWLRVPASPAFNDPRLTLRRAAAGDFEGIYDLVTTAFGASRERAAYDWIYRHNVSGIAHCWLLVEKSTGSFVGVDTNFPWPIARGTKALSGFLNGDFAIAPNWQRQGLSRFATQAALSHPWRAEQCVIGWPNLKSRGSSKKHGDADHDFGPVRRAMLPLRSSAGLTARGWPAPLCTALGFAADGAFAAWWRWRLRRSAATRIERVRRFDADFDAVTDRCMAWPDFWSPHDADFLNWRYLDNPMAGERIALSTVEAERPMGYCALELVGDRAYLAEFVAPDRRADIRRTLIAEAIRVAREAACSRIEFFAPPRWRHWRWFYSIGFVPVRSDRALYVRCPSEPFAHSLDAWQLVPGDTEIF